MSFFKTDNLGDTLVVTLANPPYNTLHSDILEEGASLLHSLAKEPPMGGIVLTGTGADFTRGMDLKVVASLAGAEIDRAIAGINSFCASLHRIPCALVCAINGHAIGAGGIMALCADWVVIARGDHKIGVPEAKAGIPFPAVPQAVLDHWLEPAWRRRLSLTSQLLTPQEAVGAGMADEVVATDAVLETAITRAKEMMAQPAFMPCKAQMRAKANAEIDALMGE